MTIRNRSFAIFDCVKDKWADKSVLEQELLRCGHQKIFAYYIFDSDQDRGFVGCAEDPIADADRVAKIHHLMPTDLVVFTIGLNLEQVEHLDCELGDECMDDGIEEHFSPDEFRKNIIRVFGGLVDTINRTREHAGPDSRITFSCDGPECVADVFHHPSLDGIEPLIDVQGEIKSRFVNRVIDAFENGNGDILQPNSPNPTFVRIVANKPEDNFNGKSPAELISDIINLKFASFIEQESNGINNHLALMGMGFIVEADYAQSVKNGWICEHFTGDESKMTMVPAKGAHGGMAFGDIANIPQTVIPRLLTVNYFVEKFNAAFQNEDPTDAEEVGVILEWLGIRGFYTNFPEDAHILCVARGLVQTIIFLPNGGDKHHIRCSQFLTPFGVIEILKALVKLRFYADSRHAIEETANKVQAEAELSTIIDRYTESFGDMMGDYLVEVLNHAYGNEERQDEDCDDDQTLEDLLGGGNDVDAFIADVLNDNEDLDGDIESVSSQPHNK